MPGPGPGDDGSSGSGAEGGGGPGLGGGPKLGPELKPEQNRGLGKGVHFRCLLLVVVVLEARTETEMGV